MTSTQNLKHRTELNAQNPLNLVMEIEITLIRFLK